MTMAFFLPIVARDVINAYNRDSKKGLSMLVYILLQACGSPVESSSTPDELSGLLDLNEIDENYCDYEDSKQEYWKDLKQVVSTWDDLVRECQHVILFDEFLFDKFMEFILVLRRSYAKLFRLVASVVGLQLVTSYSTVAKNMLRDENDAPPLRGRIQHLERLMSTMVEGVFYPGLEDIEPYIRMSCIQSCEEWISSYASFFSKQSYLKRLILTLIDQSSEVREVAVATLKRLYENVTGGLSQPLIELFYDDDISMATCIELVKLSLRHQLLAVPSKGRVIGALVRKGLATITESGDDASTTHQLSKMLEVLEDVSADTKVIHHVFEDLWDHMPVMKDWKFINGMLLNGITPSNKATTVLIQLLSTSVKKALGERVFLADENPPQKYTIGQKKQFERIKDQLTTLTIESEFQLFHKHMTDEANVQSLVEIIPHFRLPYMNKSLKIKFKAFVQVFEEAFFQHDEQDALRSCFKVIHSYSTVRKKAVQEIADIQLRTLEDRLKRELKHAMEKVADRDNEPHLLVNLKRLFQLQWFNFLPIEGLFEDLLVTLRRFGKNREESIVGFLLYNMFLQTGALLKSSGADSVTSLCPLVSIRGTLLEELQSLLNPKEAVKYGNLLACRVCTILVETWWMFREDTFSNDRKALGYRPDESVVGKFCKLCEQQFHISDEDPNNGYVEETYQNEVMAAASKLVAYDAGIKGYLGPEIISHFVKNGEVFTIIVEELLCVLKKTGVDIPNLFLEALTRAHLRHQILEDTEESLTLDVSSACKDLSVKLSTTCSSTAGNKFESHILKIVKGGVEHAFTEAPSRFSFLEDVVVHFVSKLTADEVSIILRDVGKCTDNLNIDEDNLQPVHSFVNVLKGLHDAHRASSQDEEHSATGYES